MPSDTQRQAHALYLCAVEQARSPKLYTDLAVEDSLDGRFDMIVLFTFTQLRALDDGDKAAETKQAVMEHLLADMDQSLREMGVGDMSIGKKVEKMAYAMNGRFQSYTASWGNEDELAEALWRNAYRSDEVRRDHAKQLARYVTNLKD